MATVTGLTAERMAAIEDASIVGGSIDGSGHLILVTNGGDEVDAGAFVVATTSAPGISELATSAETSALSDATRVITPAGLAALIGGINTNITALQGAPGIKPITLVAESAAPTSYPTGTSVMVPSTGSGWSLASGFGTVITTKTVSPDRTTQFFYSNVGGTSHPQMWMRTWNATDGGGGWTAWDQMARLRDIPTAPIPTVATGVFNNASHVNAGTGTSVSVTYPVGRFTTTPRVFIEFLLSSRMTSAVTANSTSGFTVRMDNFTSADNTSGEDFNWYAIKE